MKKRLEILEILTNTMRHTFPLRDLTYYYLLYLKKYLLKKNYLNKSLRPILVILTWFNKLRGHLHKKGFSNGNPKCNLCNYGEEISNRRLRHFVVQNSGIIYATKNEYNNILTILWAIKTCKELI